jgi:PAS domain S-box-containing protein
MNSEPKLARAAPNAPDEGRLRDSQEIETLRAIVEGTARTTGTAFFQELVRRLAAALNVSYAFVAEFSRGKTHARTLAYWAKDRIEKNFEWQLAGTPCEDVVRGSLCHYPTDVSRQFPGDKPLLEMGIESYLGVPLCDARGEVLGHLAVLDEEPMPGKPRLLFIFRIFAARAAVELECLRAQNIQLESEERYRDLFEEAPIGYIQEDFESRFLTANRAALRILGLKSEELPGFVGLSLVPEAPEAQRRAREALASIRQGSDASVVLELRRKDTGRPLWVQWWSKPDANGKYTRTMIVDVTDRVLAEQEKARLQQQNLYLQEEIKGVHNFEEIIGQSPPLLAVLDSVRRVAPTDTSVLISGETGTGKELVARAIHSRSKRADKPLIKINCAALPTGLVESELFGHEKGAFTGAIARRVGRFELADGGTIFLDEIGEIPPEVQVKLLRVLQERELERVGATSPLRVDVRVIAATNRDLFKAVRDGAFREDLYYRLNVFPIALPPLRERKEDIPLLVRFLLERFKTRISKEVDGVSAATMERLKAYPWPGNVRELENVLERAVILATGPTLEIEPEILKSSSTPSAAKADQTALEAVERSHILAVLERTDWVIDGRNGAAKLLDLHPSTLRSRLKKLGIKRAPHDPS